MTELPRHKCLIPGCQNLTTTRLCGEHWFKATIELRSRWWKETDFGRKEPSAELVEAFRNEHAGDGGPAPK